MIRKQSGALLLMVALLLATIAALSFGLNHAAGMDALAVQHQYDMRAAGYLAEAGVAAARWRNQVKGCTGVSMEPTTFGTGTFEAMVTKVGSKRLNVTATGTVGDGTLRKITRNNIDIADFNAKTTTRDLAGAALDTTIVYGSVWPDSARTDLSLASGVAHALLYWPAGEITSDLRVLSATLILTQNGTGAATRTVGVHRVTTQWDTYATWYAARPFTGWAGGDFSGGDFGASAVATTAVTGAGTYSWDVTSLVDGWATKRLANYGMLLRLVNPGQSATFYSLDAAVKNRPVLRVVTAKAC
jgi:hypothetical protein